jgi:hypothetical protein
MRHVPQIFFHKATMMIQGSCPLSVWPIEPQPVSLGSHCDDGRMDPRLCHAVEIGFKSARSVFRFMLVPEMMGRLLAEGRDKCSITPKAAQDAESVPAGLSDHFN